MCGSSNRASGSNWIASLTAILFGVGAALTLDEFAPLVERSRTCTGPGAGRESIDAVIIFISLLSSDLGRPVLARGGRGVPEGLPTEGSLVVTNAHVVVLGGWWV